MQATRERQLMRKAAQSFYGTAGEPNPKREVVEPPMETWKFWGYNIALYSSVIVVWIALNSAMFCALSPGLSFLDAIYFSWITATTIGYGDSELHSTAARGWCCAFILLSMALLTLGSGYFTSEVRCIQPTCLLIHFEFARSFFDPEPLAWSILLLTHTHAHMRS